MECICCNSNEIKKKFKKHSFQIYECNSCGFQFVYPLPEIETLKNHYNQTRVTNDIKERIKKYVDNVNNNSNSPKRDWFNTVLNTSEKHLKKSSLNILEIGSAYGYFVDYCNNNGHNAVGVEVTEGYAEASKGLINGEIINIDNSEYRSYFGNKKFDLIYLEHVLEHILEPKTIFKEFEFLLEENGILFIVVPNHKSLPSRVFRKYYKWTIPPEHLYYYNKDSIKSLAKNLGFAEINSWTGDYYHRSIYQFYSLDIFLHHLYRIINKLFKLKINTTHSYKYPRSFKDIFSLIPYLISSPLIKFLNKKYAMGNELIMILKKDNNH